MAWREKANVMKLVNACLSGGHTVFVVTGDRRTMLTPPQEAEQAQA